MKDEFKLIIGMLALGTLIFLFLKEATVVA